MNQLIRTTLVGMLQIVALAFALQTGPPPPLPERTHRPDRVDPGLHGGLLQDTFLAGDPSAVTPFPMSFSAGSFKGDVTPDGRLAVGYREYETGLSFCDRKAGLFVSLVRSENVVRGPVGELNFFEGLLDPATGTGGSQFAIQPTSESFLVEDTPRTIELANGSRVLDLDYLPHPRRMHPLSIALAPRAGIAPGHGANPYRSDANGNFDEHGGFLTYDLWLVCSHFYADPGADAATGAGTYFMWSDDCDGFVRDPAVSAAGRIDSKLGCRDLLVTVDERGSEAAVHSASIGVFELLELDAPLGLGSAIEGTEPTVTADGRLLVYHGDAGGNGLKNQKATYVYNPSPCSALGWEPPRSIAAMHFEEDDDFKERYPLAKYPIQDFNQFGNAVVLEGSEFWGPYPWISKDGSFMTCMHTRPFVENASGLMQVGAAYRSSLVAFGDITRGFVKRIDDTGCNPTRYGGRMDWPLGPGDTPMAAETAGGARDSQMKLAFSVGLAPGLWRAFGTRHTEVPASPHDLRIPVLPMWIPATRMYGEARFEEADGHYRLYLACNEALSQDSAFSLARSLDPTRTPDTSGRATRARCKLEGGAAFPHEHLVEALFPNSNDPQAVHQAAEELRYRISPFGVPSHENIGFRGQAILFPEGGSISVSSLDPHSATEPAAATLQAFCKVLPGWDETGGSLGLIDDGGQLDLRLCPDGSFEGRVHARLAAGGPPVVATVRTRAAALEAQPTPFEPALGWRHVAVTFDGDVGGESLLRIYLEGLLEEEIRIPATTLLEPGSTGVRIGPGASNGMGSTVNPLLVLDEVALSDVARTEGEIRRDAHVAPKRPHVPLPLDVPLDVGLDRRDTFWPADVVYSPAVAQLGRELFHSPLLSAPGVGRSCASCHQPSSALAFTDGLTLAQDIRGDDLRFNSPTTLNAGFGLRKLFEGGAESLEDQVTRPLVASVAHGSEMGVQTIEDVVSRLNGYPVVVGCFQAAFGGDATESRIADALSMYLRVLQSGDSPMDRFENSPSVSSPIGHVEILPGVLKGRALFVGKARCVTCHTGSNFSDGDFHNVGSLAPNAELTGLAQTTGRNADDGKLKTPSLRNLGKTAPYFHDGSRATLREVVEHYAEELFDFTAHDGELDRALFPIALTPAEIDDLVLFLTSLDDSDFPN